VTFSYETDKLCYLRLIPISPLAAPLLLAPLKSVAQRVPLLTRAQVVLVDLNAHGAIGHVPGANPPRGPAPLEASTQLFENGEAWSIRAGLIRTEPDGEPSGTRYPFLPCEMFEQLFYDTFHSLVEFARQHLDGCTPCNVELGLVGARGVYLPAKVSQEMYWWGPIQKHEIVYRARLTTGEAANIDGLLLDFFSLVYDSSGNTRPKGLGGFPPGRPGSRRY
jgi:hypothetical protein